MRIGPATHCSSKFYHQQQIEIGTELMTNGNRNGEMTEMHMQKEKKEVPKLCPRFLSQQAD